MSPIGRLLTSPVFTDRRASNVLKAGDVIRMLDSTTHMVQYVNQSGAYVVPLQAVNREVAGHTIAFTTGGRMISSMSAVEHLHPLQLGGSSPEYARYVRMAKSLSKSNPSVKVAGMEDQSASFDTFDTADIDMSEAEKAEAEGQTVSAESVMPNKKAGKDMAKKAKAAKAAKTNGAVRAKDKAPKTVKPCVCGCGTETTGYFAPGHDARMHGWIKKLADGRMEPKEVPASVRAKLNLKQTSTGFKATTPHYWQAAE